MNCYVVDCDTVARYRIVFDNRGTYCPDQNEDGSCPGHAYCPEHTAQWRRIEHNVLTVSSLRSSAVSS